MYLARKTYFKIIYLFYKYIAQPEHPIKSFYNVYLTPFFKDKTFEYCFRGSYGTFFSRYIEQINTTTMFIDIGANQGLYSILASKNKMIEGVVAFEPSPSTAELLNINFEINKASEYQVIQKAISNQNGSFSLNAVDGHSGKNSLREINNSTSVKIETINHTKLEKLIPPHTNYVIKIDVEGHENVVINELVKCAFFKNVSSIFCEIDEEWIDVKKIKEQLKAFGFTKFKKVGTNKVHYDLLISKE
jgi:FkbM family methyltransferase